MIAKQKRRTRKILVVMGTRPEVIKLAPVVEALNRRRKGALSGPEAERKQGTRFKTVICLTGQHREMVEPFLKIFGLKPDYDLRVMVPNQHLGELTGRVLAGMKKSEFIVAINTDKDAPIGEVADVLVVADLKQFIPVLTEKIEAM